MDEELIRGLGENLAEAAARTPGIVAETSLRAVGKRKRNRQPRIEIRILARVGHIIDAGARDGLKICPAHGCDVRVIRRILNAQHKVRTVDEHGRTGKLSRYAGW